MHSGETLTAALGDSRRCLPRRDLGGGAGSIVTLCYTQGASWVLVIEEIVKINVEAEEDSSRSLYSGVDHSSRQLQAGVEGVEGF